MLLSYKTHLSNKLQLSVDTILFTFTLDDPKEFSFIPGQYMIMIVPQENGEVVRRLYSIASSTAQKNSFELLVHIMTGGKAGMYLSNLKINDLVQFQGPAGIFTLRESERDKVFLSTGCGIAPIRSILKSIIYHPSTRYFLFWGFSTFKDVYIYDELKRIKAQNPNFNFTICLSRETNLDMIPVEDRKHFMLGHITDGFNKFLELPLQGEQVTSYKLQESDFYLCSRREVIDSLKIYLASIGALKEQVYFEKF